MTRIASSNWRSVVGLRPRTRTTEEPRSLRARRAPEDAHGGVAAPDAADGAVAEHVVEGGEGRGRNRRVAANRVCDEGPDDDLLRSGEHLRVDDVGLLPEDVRVEGPRVGEAVLLGSLC